MLMLLMFQIPLVYHIVDLYATPQFQGQCTLLSVVQSDCRGVNVCQGTCQRQADMCSLEQ